MTEPPTKEPVPHHATCSCQVCTLTREAARLRGELQDAGIRQLTLEEDTDDLRAEVARLKGERG
jgi:hypothetical protein